MEDQDSKQLLLVVEQLPPQGQPPLPLGDLGPGFFPEFTAEPSPSYLVPPLALTLQLLAQSLLRNATFPTTIPS